MVLDNVLAAFSSPYLYPLIVFVTLFFIAALHFFFSIHYGHDAQRDTPAFLYGFFVLLILSTVLFGISTPFTALCLGAFFGEITGLFSVTLYKHKIHKE